MGFELLVQSITSAQGSLIGQHCSPYVWRSCVPLVHVQASVTREVLKCLFFQIEKMYCLIKSKIYFETECVVKIWLYFISTLLFKEYFIF